MDTQKQIIRKEVVRLSKLLNKRAEYVTLSISWNRKTKNNTIQINDVLLLKEKGMCTLFGIVYFTVSTNNRIFVGQTMLLLDRNDKEISYTILFFKKKKIEISYEWLQGLRLMATSLNELGKLWEYISLGFSAGYINWINCCNYHFLRDGQAGFTSMGANPGKFIQSIIVCLSVLISLSCTFFVNWHQADSASLFGSKGFVGFQSGVDFVLISSGVVGEAGPVVNP